MTKFASTEVDIGFLKKESRMYRHLATTALRKHLPVRFGLFRSHAGVYALLLEYVGQSLPTKVNGPKLGVEMRLQIR